MALHNVGSMVMTFASVHLAASIPNFYRCESRLGRSDRTVEPMALGRLQLIKDSMFQLPKGPGFGLEIDPDFTRKHTPKGEDWA